MPVHKMPLCRTEIAIQCITDGQLCTLLVEREEAPYKGFWGLPGGVLRVDLDADLNAAAHRVAKERLGIIPSNLRQMTTVGAKGRDPRGESSWGLSVVYRALIPVPTPTFTPGKRVVKLQWAPMSELPTNIAFDHIDLIAQAANQTRTDVANLSFPAGFVKASFTLGELQILCEQVLGYQLDKASFRRKLRDRNLVQVVDGQLQRGSAHRPAAIYRLQQTAVA